MVVTNAKKRNVVDVLTSKKAATAVCNNLRLPALCFRQISKPLLLFSNSSKVERQNLLVYCTMVPELIPKNSSAR